MHFLQFYSNLIDLFRMSTNLSRIYFKNRKRWRFPLYCLIYTVWIVQANYCGIDTIRFSGLHSIKETGKELIRIQVTVIHWRMKEGRRTLSYLSRNTLPHTKSSGPIRKRPAIPRKFHRDLSASSDERERNFWRDSVNFKSRIFTRKGTRCGQWYSQRGSILRPMSRGHYA
jgi:hypothetical protein